MLSGCYNNIKYYQVNPEQVSIWQGICPTNKNGEYLIVGTASNGTGAIYKGLINIPSTARIDNIIFPGSTSTSVYGPEYQPNYWHKDIITVVGSYQTGQVGIAEPCKGFGYTGKYGDFTNTKNYFEIIPDETWKYTVVHSTRAGLAVYISSDIFQLNLFVGKSFIYDIDKKETITQVLYPDSLLTTTYGIWYNGRKCNYDFYTIAGGFSLDNLLTDTRTFIVDFYYNRCEGKMYFENWTEIKIPGISLYTHAQGITGLNHDEYALPIANFKIDPNDTTKLVEIDGARITIKRVNKQFLLTSQYIISVPESSVTIVTSAAKNNVVGLALDINTGTKFAYQASIL